MKKIILISIAVAGVFLALVASLSQFSPKALSNDEIINQTRHCEVWGLNANYTQDYSGRPTQIFCVPK